MIEELVDFHNRERNVLRGTLYKPEGIRKYHAVIVAHYSQGGTRTGDAYRHLSRTLTQIGMGVFVFDRRGQGQSEENFDEASFEELTSDLLAAKDALRMRQDIKQVGLWGMSQGGWLSPFAASLSSNIAFLIIVSGATITPAEQMIYSATFVLEKQGFTPTEVNEMQAVRRLYDDYYRKKTSYTSLQKELEKVKSQAWFPFAYVDSDVPADVEKTTWHKILDFDSTTSINLIDIPVLVMYGEVDPWIPIEESISQWQKRSMTNLTVKQIKGANHFMLTISGSGVEGDTGMVSSQYQQVMVGWLKKYVL